MGGGIAVMQAAVEPASVEGLILSSSVYPWARGGMPSPVIMGGFALYRSPIGEWAVKQRLNAGNAEQIGAPLEVYERPATVFVAGFIGAPAMNLLPVRSSGAGSLQLGSRRFLPQGPIAEALIVWPDTGAKELQLLSDDGQKPPLPVEQRKFRSLRVNF